MMMMTMVLAMMMMMMMAMMDMMMMMMMMINPANMVMMLKCTWQEILGLHWVNRGNSETTRPKAANTTFEVRNTNRNANTNESNGIQSS